jgi:nitrate/nitrite transport system ATP-binding protein
MMNNTKREKVPYLPVLGYEPVNAGQPALANHLIGLRQPSDWPGRKKRTMSGNDRYLELWRLSKSYPKRGGGQTTVVTDFNLTVKQGEFVSLIGHSGCGKSTVLSIVAGLSELTTGGIILAGREIDGAGPDRGMVFQSPSLLPWRSAFENVMLGVEQVRPELTRKQRAEIVEHYLELVGLGDAMKKLPAELSAGMRQRVGLARAFALNPKMLLLDEPFGMLDSLTRYELQQVLIELWSTDQKTALMVTHDVDEALFLSDRIVMMTNGPNATVGDILSVPFARPRDRATVMEHPDYDALRNDLVGFLERQGHKPEEVPSPLLPPPGSVTKGTPSRMSVAPPTAASKTPTVPSVAVANAMS